MRPVRVLRRYLIAWWRLSRIPFLSVGILPLILGFVLAWRSGYRGSSGLYLVSAGTVILIMWMTYYVGEWNDLEGDRLNQDFNRFSGGSRVLVKEAFPAWVSLLLGYGCLAAAILIGIHIYLRYQTDLRTLLLGGLGLFFGFFYSSKPFRWSYHGLGEILIGFCYGWLPIATGFFLLAGYFSPQILLFSIPVGLSIFNVILINEFPDREADHAVGKKNLVVRLGEKKAGDLYAGLSLLTGLSFMKMMWEIGPSPYWLFLLSGIPSFLIVWNLFQIWREDYHERRELELLCRNTLFVNLCITMILTLQQTVIGPRLTPLS
ncbi:MAG TPA: prenyltransferase [Thermodesulfobacteriota bacterium]|nr:prenyltransferase [Thermodesulfobacteriota bacterium]